MVFVNLARERTMGSRRNFRLDNLPNLLEQPTSGLKGQEAEAERKQHPLVVGVVAQYLADRYELGKCLAEYRTVFKREKIWVKVYAAVVTVRCLSMVWPTTLPIAYVCRSCLRKDVD